MFIQNKIGNPHQLNEKKCLELITFFLKKQNKNLLLALFLFLNVVKR